MSKLFRSIPFILIFALLLSATSCNTSEIDAETSADAEATVEIETAIEYNTTQFNNPISFYDAPDPFITYDPETGYYYALHTQGDRIEIFRHKHAADVLVEGESKVIFRATGENAVWGDIWAPEMHKGPDGVWYIYTSSRTSRETGGEKRIFVLGALSSDPFGEWEFKGRPAFDIFSIDPTVYTAPDGTQYMCYSRVDAQKGQVLDIAKMRDPYTCYNGKTIAYAELEWELVEPYVGTSAILEGAFFLENNGKLFIIYSANGCWSNHYALGILEYIGGDLCSASSWKKHPEPLLTYGNEVYGPGHASFFRSPDGTEVWCAYHGMLLSNDTVTYTERYCHIQKVEFDENGYPVMGKPIGYDDLIDPPSGEIK